MHTTDSEFWIEFFLYIYEPKILEKVSFIGSRKLYFRKNKKIKFKSGLSSSIKKFALNQLST